MFKFLLLTALLLGLVFGEVAIVSENQQLEAASVDSEQVSSEEVSSESQDSMDSDEEEEEEDDSGALDVDNLVSENDQEEFDQEDDFGSAALEDDDNNEQDDEAAGRHSNWRKSCKGYGGARKAFYIRRRQCHRCIRHSRKCRGICGRYRRARMYNIRNCRRKTLAVYRRFRGRLRANWKRIMRVLRIMRKIRWRIYYARRRMRRKRGRYIRRKMGYHARRYHFWRRKYYRRRRVYYALSRAMRRRYWLWRRARSTKAKKYHARIYRRLALRRRKVLKKMKHHLRMMRHHLKWYRIYHRRYFYNKKIHKYLKQLRYWNVRRHRLYRARRVIVWKMRRAAAIARRGCAKRITHLYRACLHCKGHCGPKCWRMHMSYARFVMASHKCHMHRMFCHRAIAYKRYAWRYGRSCTWCKKRRNKKVMRLLCAGVCGAAYKFRLLRNYYRGKC